MINGSDYTARYPNWNDWKWQLANRITSVDKLSKLLRLSEPEKADIHKCLEHFRMAITPYYASLIRPGDPEDPVRMQCVPSIRRPFPVPTT